MPLARPTEGPRLAHPLTPQTHTCGPTICRVRVSFVNTAAPESWSGAAAGVGIADCGGEYLHLCYQQSTRAQGSCPLPTGGQPRADLHHAWGSRAVRGEGPRQGGLPRAKDVGLGLRVAVAADSKDEPAFGGQAWRQLRPSQPTTDGLHRAGGGSKGHLWWVSVRVAKKTWPFAPKNGGKNPPTYP